MGLICRIQLRTIDVPDIVSPDVVIVSMVSLLNEVENTQNMTQHEINDFL